MDCAAPRHELEPADAETSAYLCRSCRRGLSRNLRRIPALYAELDPTPGRATSRGRGQGDGLPYNDAVSEIASQIRHDLAWWAKHWAQDRHAKLPDFDDDEDQIVPVLAGYLYGSVKFMVFRDWAGQLAETIAADYRQILATLDPHPVSRFAAYCACPDCETGQLVCVIYGEDDKRRPLVECDTCDAYWTGEQWLRLGARIRSLAAAA